jgi:hypothetical protein
MARLVQNGTAVSQLYLRFWQQWSKPPSRHIWNSKSRISVTERCDLKFEAIRTGVALTLNEAKEIIIFKSTDY